MQDKADMLSKAWEGGRGPIHDPKPSDLKQNFEKGGLGCSTPAHAKTWALSSNSSALTRINRCDCWSENMDPAAIQVRFLPLPGANRQSFSASDPASHSADSILL
jgi:hypothetical protein